MSELIQQAGQNAELYQSAGNLTVNKTYINYDQKTSLMKELVKKYHEEKQKGTSSEVSGYIRRLERYVGSADTEFVGLEKKLEDGGFNNDIDWAMAMKEQYSKMLQEHKFSKATQQIHAYLLAWVLILFNQFALEAIRKNLPNETVKEIINDKIIASIEAVLGGDNNVLDLYADDINGMIYFLTGNCHLKWK